MGNLAVVMQQDLGPKGLPLALLKTMRVDGDLPRFATAQTKHKDGREEFGKGVEDIMICVVYWYSIQ
jgi:hypothetical protein